MTVETRLRALERHVNGGKLSPGVSLILADENGWRLLFSLWDGVGSKDKVVESTHVSEDEALEEYAQFLAKHHIRAGAAQLIIIDV